VWTEVSALTPALDGQRVLVRARLHAVRSKGKSAFLVLRQQTATAQAVLFVDEVTVSRGMVEYAAATPRESIVDVEGEVTVTEGPVDGCSQSEVGKADGHLFSFDTRDDDDDDGDEDDSGAAAASTSASTPAWSPSLPALAAAPG